MARIGLKNFNWAGLNEAEKFEDCTYEQKKDLKGAIECKVALDIAEGELYADDQLWEQSSVVSKGTITMGVADDDDAIFAELLGQKVGDSGIKNYIKTKDATVNSSKTYYEKTGNEYTAVTNPTDENIADYYEGEVISEYTSTNNDTPKDIGFGHIVTKIVRGVRKYKVEFFPKVRFKPFIPDAKSKGSSLEFATPSVEGTVFTLEDGTWEKHATFSNEVDAKTYLDSLFKQAN